MTTKEIQNHKFIKLIEFALTTQNFTIQQALDATGMSQNDFESAKQMMFTITGLQQHARVDERVPWRLTPTAFFNYLSFLQYQHAIKFSKKAVLIAVVSLAVAVASLAVNLW